MNEWERTTEKGSAFRFLPALFEVCVAWKPHPYFTSPITPSPQKL